MYTECQKCGYQFVKSDSKTINNIGKNIFFLELRQKANLKAQIRLKSDMI